MAVIMNKALQAAAVAELVATTKRLRHKYGEHYYWQNQMTQVDKLRLCMLVRRLQNFLLRRMAGRTPTHHKEQHNG